MFAFLEGSKGIYESLIENKKTIENEIQIVKRFFNRSFVNDSFILNEINEIVKANWDVINYEESKNEMVFIEKLHKILYQPIKREKKEAIKENIFKIASENNVAIGSLIVYCALGVLYANNKLRKIFKFTNSKTSDEVKKLSYNSHNDIKNMVRVCQYILELKKMKDESIVKYITFDEGLNYLYGFLENAMIKEKKINCEDYTNITLYVNGFFPDLTDKEVVKLGEEILSKT